MSYYYLASPYSKFKAGIVDAYVAACEQAAVMVRAGVPVFCPIAHSHGIAWHGGIDPYSHAIWMPTCQPMMEVAKGIIVCMIDGWLESYGVRKEIEYFTRAKKPVIYMTPGVSPFALTGDV